MSLVCQLMIRSVPEVSIYFNYDLSIPFTTLPHGLIYEKRKVQLSGFPKGKVSRSCHVTKETLSLPLNTKKSI